MAFLPAIVTTGVVTASEVTKETVIKSVSFATVGTTLFDVMLTGVAVGATVSMTKGETEKVIWFEAISVTVIVQSV